MAARPSKFLQRLSLHPDVTVSLPEARRPVHRQDLWQTSDSPRMRADQCSITSRKILPKLDVQCTLSELWSGHDGSTETPALAARRPAVRRCDGAPGRPSACGIVKACFSPTRICLRRG